MLSFLPLTPLAVSTSIIKAGLAGSINKYKHFGGRQPLLLTLYVCLFILYFRSYARPSVVRNHEKSSHTQKKIIIIK